ncbi:polynucleotide adenylyltransferase PcnB [Sulfuriferula nivalis]|uniref:Poly(A) polymerase I n=1 Tax=Sulfuriferula nivalis TaxID=2675298 RepID=A0A809RI23_9PROT|nr:polynucleotide adenylyltransferase PcnB [Sulfuriferula nivalis]BBP01256.1 poly(A) polymerase I [Sulfuriferula nivalis]
MIKKFINRVLGKKSKTRLLRIPVNQHKLTREQILPCALKVTDTLQQAGYSAFVVGGAVRDLLIGKTPKDFDVATNATPEQVRDLFRRSRIIGRRFRLVHVMCGNDTIEVSTFRASAATEEDDTKQITDDTGRIVRDNVFGDQESDAERRDFTVNALYYDPSTEEILDYRGGVADINNKILRIIGDPATRYREDPVRMMRAARFAAKLDFHIDETTRAPIAELAELLGNVPPSRMFDEMLKLLLSGHALRAVHQLRAEGLHHGILPMLDTILEQEHGKRFINAALHNTDLRLQAGKSVSPAFLFASLLWHELQINYQKRLSRGELAIPAFNEAMEDTLNQQRNRLAVPRRLDGMMKEVWSLQARFEQRSGSRPYRLLTHPRFRAGYDFLLLRAESGEIATELAEWWTTFHVTDEETRASMLLTEPVSTNKPKRRRRTKKPAIAVTHE